MDMKTVGSEGERQGEEKALLFLLGQRIPAFGIDRCLSELETVFRVLPSVSTSV